MKKFIYIAEVKLEESRCNDVENDGILVEDFINSVLSDHGRDRGFLMTTRVMETEKSKYDLAVNTVFESIKIDVVEDLENEILTNRMCLGGNCEV
jgi:hypothetical protein